MYAIVKTGGKQYRVQQGQSLLVERLPAAEGDSVTLEPLLCVDGSKVVDQVDGLSGVKVEARVVAHERGPKLRIVKFKPKRGYKRRNGHRQELTRLEVTGINVGAGRSRAAKAETAPAEAKAGAAEKPAAKPAAPAKPRAAAKPKAAAPAEAKAESKVEAAAESKAEAAAEKPAAAAKKPAAAKPKAPAKPRTPRAPKTSEEETDGT